MKVDLKYFSGTGNSYKIIDTCREIFSQNGCTTTVTPITNSPGIDDNADLIGFCFPVYAFGIPRICRLYLKALPKLQRSVDTFVMITAGDPYEAGFSVSECNTIFKQKGLNPLYSKVIHMPANWTVQMTPPSSKEAQSIINAGVNHARKATHAILNGESYHHEFNYPPSYTKFRFFKDYYLFKWLGVSNLWREFRTDDTCDGCGLCKALCPTSSILMTENRPIWSNTCEQCMRCVNYCPKKAIFQKSGGSIKDKNTYHEPGFKPLKLEK